MIFGNKNRPHPFLCFIITIYYETFFHQNIKTAAGHRDHFEHLKMSARLGHPKARELLKPGKKDPDAERVTKKGEVIAFCEEVPENCYWKYKGYAWYQSLKPASIEKVCPIDDFEKKVQAGKIKAEMMDDWLE
jgi:hypothetical protein